jgi:DNA-binding transcriptional ArsR family regulator
LNTADIEQMSNNAIVVTDVLKSMAHPTRLMICCLLIENELSVGQINETFNNVSQSVVSQHLNKLKKTNLVRTRRESQTIYYSLKGTRSVEIIKLLQSLYC